MRGLPYRGSFGDTRPATVAGLRLPPEPMPSHHGVRPLKAWRYVGVFARELMLCIGLVRVGRIRQSFWAVWDGEHLHEATHLGRREVRLSAGRAEVESDRVSAWLTFQETPGIETVSRSGASYAWTRKQGGLPVRGTVRIDGASRELRARAVVDDSAGYHERHTTWRWCAGVGHSLDGRELAWNLVDGVHDARAGSERTLWVEGLPQELPPVAFDRELRGVGSLHFSAQAERARRDNLLVVRSVYRQPFGTFSGELPGGIRLVEGFGVMEAHDARW